MKKLCVVATVELPIRFFMIPHLQALQEIYDVTVVVNTDNPEFLKEYGITARVIPIGIRRDISLFNDLRAMVGLTTLFRSEKFHIIHSIAPKAGLLGMMAGCFARTPLRLHCFTGQVWATCAGMKRILLINMDRLIAGCATHLLTDSHSQRDLLIREGIAEPFKLTVLAEGSVSGVDLERFKPDDEVRDEVRREFDIPHEGTVCLYLGRITKDKGVLDLAHALRLSLARFPETYALFVGPDEGELQEEILSLLADVRGKVRFIGYTKRPERFIAAADFICLPSYREGFGMVIMEAAAMGIPALASKIYGITDAIIDNATGILHSPGSRSEIVEGLNLLLSDRNLRIRLGTNAYKRAREKFSQQTLVAALLEYYRSMDYTYETTH